MRSRVLRERRASGKILLTVVVGKDELSEIAMPRRSVAVFAIGGSP
jgi:hypothetical protein